MSAGVVPFGIQGIFKAGTQVILTSKVSFLHVCFLLFSFFKVLVQEVSPLFAPFLSVPTVSPRIKDFKTGAFVITGI